MTLDWMTLEIYVFLLVSFLSLAPVWDRRFILRCNIWVHGCDCGDVKLTQSRKEQRNILKKNTLTSLQQAWLVLHFRIVAGNNLMTLMWSACRLRDSCGHCAEYAKMSCTFFHLDAWLITGHKWNFHSGNYED